MLPAIDMINHATEPGKRNTLLRKSSAEMTVKVNGAPFTLHGFFTMKAGQLQNICACMSAGFSYPQHIHTASCSLQLMPTRLLAAMR